MSPVPGLSAAGIAPEDSGILGGVFSVLSESVLIFDPEGYCVWLNPTAVEIFGPDCELLGRRWQDLPREDLLRRVFQESWQAALERGAPVRESLAQPGPGGLRHFELTLSPVRLKAGPVQALVAILADVTHRRQMEDALRQTEEQLRHAQKVDALGKLAGGIAHDFNNLMTVVNGYSDLLLQSLPPEGGSQPEGGASPGVGAPAKGGRPSENAAPQEGLAEPESLRALVQEIRKAGQKAAMLTQQLLAFSRKQTSQRKPLDMNQVVQDMEKMLRRALSGPIELETVLSPDMPLAVGDPGQLAQVLMNLVLNARDAMPRGGRIRIRTFVALLDGTEVALMLSPGPGRFPSLAVEDQGHGIGPEIRNRLFEPFFSTKEKGKGTGLGLSTVFNILKETGGGIGLESQPRVGSTFTVHFPASESAEGGRERTSDAPAAQRARQSATILLVEDEDPVRRLVASILRGEGYRVVEAESGAKALQAFSSQVVDLVLSDIIMPGMSGRELAEALQSLQPALKVVFMSGYIDDEAFVEGLGEGGIPFLSKPFSPHDLTALIRETLAAPAETGKTSERN